MPAKQLLLPELELPVLEVPTGADTGAFVGLAEVETGAFVGAAVKEGARLALDPVEEAEGFAVGSADGSLQRLR